jgi:hypothetical protein
VRDHGPDSGHSVPPILKAARSDDHRIGMAVDEILAGRSVVRTAPPFEQRFDPLEPVDQAMQRLVFRLDGECGFELGTRRQPTPRTWPFHARHLECGENLQDRAARLRSLSELVERRESGIDERLKDFTSSCHGASLVVMRQAQPDPPCPQMSLTRRSAS